MRMPQGAEWLILLLIVVLLFGAKRMPEAARGLGRSLRIFKAETKSLSEDDADLPAVLPASASNNSIPDATQGRLPSPELPPAREA